MANTKKIRLVFEADIQQDAEVTPEAIKRILGSLSNYSEWTASEDFRENLRANQALLAALLSNPEKYKQFFFETLGGFIETLSPAQFLSLAGQPPEDKDLLRSLVPTLPEESAAYFQEAIENGVFSDSNDLTFFSLDVKPTRVYIEDVE